MMKTKQRISWERFFDNTSSRESLMEFVEDKRSFKWLMENCWEEDCKIQVRRMKAFGAKKARVNARRALAKRMDCLGPKFRWG